MLTLIPIYNSIASTNSILFTDGFESAPLGTFHWNAQGLVPPNWAIDMDPAPETVGEVINTGAHSGSRCVKFYAAPADNNLHRTRYSAIFHREYPSVSVGTEEIYLSWYERIENLPPISRSFFIAFMSSGRSTYGADKDNRIFIRNDGGQYKLQLSRYWSGQDNENYAEANIPLQAGIWHHYELYYKYSMTNGEYRIWFNGVPIITITGIDTTPRGKDATGAYTWHNPVLDPSEWQIYLPKGIDAGLFNTDNQNSYTTYLDDVVIADYNAHGGVIPTPGPTPSPLSSPTPTPAGSPSPSPTSTLPPTSSPSPNPSPIPSQPSTSSPSPSLQPTPTPQPPEVSPLFLYAVVIAFVLIGICLAVFLLRKRR